MIALEILGWFALFGLGGLLAYAGVVTNLCSLVFSGRHEAVSWIMGLIGLALIIVAIVLCPFHVSLK